MVDWESAKRPCSKRATGRELVLPHGTRKWFVWVDADGQEIASTGGWEMFYDTPAQEQEHKRLMSQ